MSVADRLGASLADRYRIERELGQGGMATVYLAHDLKHDRKVAIKVLRPELAAVIGAERFLSEIKTTANLQHPQILPLHDSGEADGFLFYVMPFVEGESLRDRLTRDKQLPIPDAVRIATEVAGALDYAHRHNVIHRDIKPENILLHDGHALVADFGIALAASKAGNTRMTETGMSLGTPHYMSPEQAMGEREITARSDVYALGSVLYEMLTGEPPFTGATAQAIVARVLTETPRPLALQRHTIPEPVEVAVLTALEKLPADRYASAAEFAVALTSTQVTARHDGRTVARGVARGVPHGRRGTWIAGAAALVFAGLAAWGWSRPAPAKQVIRYNLGFLPGQEMVQGVTGMNLAISPDGRWVVYTGPGPGGHQLWLRARDRLDATPIPGTVGGVDPFFSPDGTKIAFFSGADFALTIVPVAGGPPIRLGERAPGAGGGAWGPDGWIYYDTPNGTARIRADGGTPELLIPYDTATHEIGFAWTDALPNGKGLVFRARRVAGPTDFDIDAYDLRTHTRHFLLKGLIARYVEPGRLVVVRADGAVLAVPFDQDQLRLTGPAVSLFEGLMIKPLGSADIAISRSGTLMYVPGPVTTGGTAEGIEVDRRGRITPFTPPFTFNPSANYALSLSPDGRHVATDHRIDVLPEIWTEALPSGPLSRLTFDSGGAIRPRWSADGKYVYYVSLLGSAARSELWRTRGDGSTAPERVWADPKWSIWAFSLSRDGQWLVYRMTVANNDRDLWAVHLGHDTIPRPLLTSPSLEDAPALSPDGRWLAYISNESSRNEVYVRPFPNVNDGRWQVSVAGGVAPSWSRDGRSLYFQDLNAALFEARVTTTPTFANGTPVKLLDGSLGLTPSAIIPDYDELPGGRGFLMTRPAMTGQSADTSAPVVVENWTTELLARMKGR